jgi:signal transduction histidine kinase
MNYRSLLSWLSLAMLIALVCVLGALQYRWIGEISEIEQKKLQDYLRTSLAEISREFNSELSNACAALLPTNADVDELGRQRAYEQRYAKWKNSTNASKLFDRIAVTWEQNGQITLQMLNLESDTFAESDWPASWSAMNDRIAARLRGGGPPGPSTSTESTSLIEIPRFGGFGRRGPPGPGHPGEQEWLIVEIDPGYVASTVLPELLARHFGSNFQAEYQIDVFTKANPPVAIYQTGARNDRAIADAAASVSLFDVMPQVRERGGPGPGRGPGWGRPGVPRPDALPPPGERGPGPGRGFSAAGDPGRGRWQLSIRLNAGSLETVVGRARQRNLAISAAILLLMLATAGALVRFSRQAQRLAEMEMEFVTGVSHELRTPLTVIRTAAFNLRGRLAGNPSQVERYGTLIRQESEKLTAIVEQVLQFASAKRGRVIRRREPVSVESIIDDSLQSTRGILEHSLCQVDKEIEPGLPLILGDSMALTQAIQNLIHNAVKYGIDGNHWIGVFARTVPGPHGNDMVEIQVSDRGPGIPRDEQRHIFDAFFRGKRAVADQVHGTGLGLNLVKKIVEAHGGTVAVQSEPGAGTNFMLRIPACPMEWKDEFTHSSG